MNMVKRIMGRPRQEECSPQDNALGLMHLRRLFSELCHPPRQMTQKEQEDKLYMMLPVFNRVFGNASPTTMTEKFQDLLQFTTQVSRLMVTEIRRRASNKSTEEASRAIVQFLEVNQSEEASRGWMLLTTINLLASSGQKTVDCMTTMSVPSTLVKCLYLFFDLPHMAEAPGATETPELPLADRRALLQKVFVQILVKLCSFVSPAEELTQKDDLQLLFSAITSWCPPHNLPWRKSAGQVLTTISRHGLSVNVVKYIHEKECLATCIQNMQQSDDLSPLEIVEMFAGLSCFLKDSSDVSQTLLDDFRMSQGYTFLCDLMLRLEQTKEEDSSDALKDLVSLVTCLTTYGVTELKPAGLTTGAPFLLPGFVLPQPSGKGHTVRNLQSFAVLQNAFLRAKTSLLTSTLLDAIGNIYAADHANYFILEAQHTLSQFADKVAKLPDAQEKYFDLLEFVVFSLNYVPCKELFSVSVLLKGSTSYTCSITATRTLLKLSRHDAVFSDVLREVGLLEVLVNLLHKYAALLKDPATGNGTEGDCSSSVAEEQRQLAWLVMETLTVLLQGSNTNAGTHTHTPHHTHTHTPHTPHTHHTPPTHTRFPRSSATMESMVVKSDGSFFYSNEEGVLLPLNHLRPTHKNSLAKLCMQSFDWMFVPFVEFIVRHNFLSVSPSGKDSKTGELPYPVALVPEEKVSFSLYALSVSALTVAKIRKVYNKLDSKAIAKQLAVSSHENATPVKLIHNATSHLNGPARTIGAAVIGYLGVRAFVPKPVATNLQYVGGAAAILGLVAMAQDVEGLYAAVKALVCVVKSNPLASKEMERIKGYQLLAMLLKKKRHLLNSHILHLTFSLVGTVDSSHETSIIPNTTAFQDLLCDFEVWLHAPYELHLSLFEHFIELLTESSEATNNAKLLREFQLIPKLLLTLRNTSLSQPTISAISHVLSLLLQGFPNPYHLLRFGQFISSTLPTFAVCEKFVVMEINNEEKIDGGNDDDFGGLLSANLILLRNRLLDILLKLLFTTKEKCIVNAQACEELVRTLGFDWLLMFMEEHLHSSSVTAALWILVVLLSNQPILTKFKEGLTGGGWLDHTDSVLTNKIGTVLGFNVGRSAGGHSTLREINRDACHFPGFPVLQTLLPKHTNVPELYFLLMTLFLQQPVTELPDSLQFDLDSIWTFIFGVPASNSTVVGSIHTVCTEAGFLLLGMLRSMLNLPWQSEEEGSWLREYPVTLMQFFRYLYHNVPDLAHMWHSPEFLCVLAASVFPFNIRPYSEMVSDLDNEAGSPTEEFKAFSADTCMNRSQSEYCNVGSKTYLTNHPAKKYVFDFMKVLIMDNLCLTPASKQTSTVDLLLEASPERSTRTQQKEFQSYILDSVMEHLLAADVLLSEDASLLIISGGSYQVLTNNVFYFTQRVVDKLWQGMFNKESKMVVEFIVQLIGQSKRRSQGLSLESIYHCLNRTVLYQLSRPHKTVPQQVALLDSLRVLTVNRNLVLGPGNHDQEFVACLAHCFINLHVGSSVEGFGLEAEARMTTWHVMMPAENEPDDTHSQDVSEGRQLLLKAVNRVWTELMHSKRPMLEDIFKVSLPTNDRGHVDISTARPALEEPALKSWQNHLVHERKCISRGESVAPASQSKLSRVSSGFGLSKLTGARRNKKENSLNKNNLSAQETFQWMFTHIAVVRDLVAMQYKEYQERQQNVLKYVTEEWSSIEYELLRERGLWGPPIGSHLDKFLLEMTEGPCRMRKKMVRNDMFYIHYPYVPEPEPSTNGQKPVRYRRAISYDSKEYYMRLLSGNPGMYQHSVEQDTEGETTRQEPGEVHGEDTIARVRGLVKAPLKRSRSTADRADEEQDLLQEQLLESGGLDEEQRTDNTSLLRLLEEGEQIQHMYRCARVQGLDTSEGLLLFGKEHFYVIDGFTMTVSREIRDIETLPANLHETIIPRGARQGQSQLKRTCSIFAYEDIKEVHKRRYLLQPMAVEVFSGDGRNYLLAFQKGVRNKVYQRFLAVVPSLADSSESVSGQRPNTSVEQGSGLLSTLVGEKSVTQRWERGEISNFQYLMHLNTLAGRSYNDLMQYPVFPWILADYDSEELDLNNPQTFRNLAKPMGAQTDDRLTQYKKRFKDWEDPTSETPAYHYGTHYSSAMIVASYLVRMEPFTQIFLRLQGGHFDLADRMFHSVREAWLSAAKHNMADVKELIPEFFYLPEFMLNSNNFDLGAKQNGIRLRDVLLPPWAKGDPREFIRVHRQALECDFVSAHLHEWIDLIFGFKQQGPPAVEAVNVFHHLFYEGQVDIYNINDPLKETATIGFINNFGQIPKQLFKKPHPTKRVRSKSNGEMAVGLPVSLSSTTDKIFFHHLDNLRPSLAPVKELKEPVGQIVCTEKGILAVEQNKVLQPPVWNKTFAWGYADLSCRLANYESDKAVVVYECLSEWGQILCAICPNPKLVVTGGTSTAICVWETGASKERAKTLTLKQALLGHTDAVTCLTASSAYHILVSGSRDRTCIIWDLNKLSFVTQLRGHRAPVSALCINELTGDIVSSAGTYIHVWSINGSPIASANTFTGRSQQILCCCVSEMNEWDTQNVIVTGHTDGVVRFWRMEFLQVPETPAPVPIEPPDVPDCCTEDKLGRSLCTHNADDDSSESDGDEPRLSKESKPSPRSQPGSTVHRPKGPGIIWSVDSGSDDLSLDEKDGFVFVNYSEGQTGRTQTPSKPEVLPPHPVAGHGGVPQPVHPTTMEARPYNQLRAGYRWERQLVFRSKLTMHTAFNRKDNAHPAEITSLAISKDHSKILVGDGRGRVFSWSVSDQPGRSAADHWVKDEVVDSCSGCSVRFSLTERRHHCRNCGQLFCQKCSRFQSEIQRLKISSPVRVCQDCYCNLQHERSAEDGCRN
uniref:WD repeat and FYVE domain containing 3 n=1 Tax=Salmo trutta TaxID=8032 RepID=A0A673WZ34_SALTR